MGHLAAEGLKCRDGVPNVAVGRQAVMSVEGFCVVLIGPLSDPDISC